MNSTGVHSVLVKSYYLWGRGLVRERLLSTVGYLCNHDDTGYVQSFPLTLIISCVSSK